MLGRRYPKQSLPNVPQPHCTKAFPVKMLGCEGHFDKIFFPVQIRNAYSPIRYPYYEITQGYDETTLGINGSRESVGFGLSVRAERTGSPSGRTNDHQGCFLKKVEYALLCFFVSNYKKYDTMNVFC